MTFLSRYPSLQKPAEKHFLVAKQVLRYLKGTIELGISNTRDLAQLIMRDKKLNVLYAWSDSDLQDARTRLVPLLVI